MNRPTNSPDTVYIDRATFPQPTPAGTTPVLRPYTNCTSPHDRRTVMLTEDVARHLRREGWHLHEADVEHMTALGSEPADVGRGLVQSVERDRLADAAADLLAVARYCVDNPDFDSATLDRMARAAIAKTSDATLVTVLGSSPV